MGGSARGQRRDISAANRGVEHFDDVDDRARLQRMLDFEAALARATASVGIITAIGAGEIVDACNAERYDIDALAEDASAAGNLAIPVVKALTDDAR